MQRTEIVKYLIDELMKFSALFVVITLEMKLTVEFVSYISFEV